MAAPVRIEARAWDDIRFRTLARLLKMADPDLALIKVARLWSWQTEHYTPDNPTYAIDRDTIESVLGEGGPEALVRAKLATETPDGWRMHGTEGAIEWCSDLSEKRQRAGQARAAAARRDIKGRLVGNEGYREPAHAGHAGPSTSSTAPAQSSAPSPAPDPSPEEKNLSLAHAIPTSTEHSPGPRTTLPQSFAAADVARARVRGSLAEATWQRLSELRLKHSAKLGVAAPFPFATITPSNQPRGFRELLDRIREEGESARDVCDHVLHVLDKQATDEKSVEWLAEKAFLAGPWEKARNTVLQKRRTPAAASPPPPVPPESLAGSADLAAAFELLGITKELT